MQSGPITITPTDDRSRVAVSMTSAVFMHTAAYDDAYAHTGIQTAKSDETLVLRESPPSSPATGAPTISGTAQVSQTLTANTSVRDCADADGLTSVTYSYQWLSSRDTEIDGATSSTYTLQASDNGKAIKVRVTFTDDADADNEESLTSAATAAMVTGGLQKKAALGCARSKRTLIQQLGVGDLHRWLQLIGHDGR